MFDFRSPDKHIIELLIKVVRQGTFVKNRPGNCKEIFGKGIFLVVLTEGDQLHVVTCLGDIRYLKWIRKEGANKKYLQILPAYSS